MNETITTHGNVDAFGERHAAVTWLVNALLLAASGLFLFGIFLPLFTLHQFWIFDHSVSLISGLSDLFRQGQYFVFTVIAVFSVLVPALKLGLLASLWNFQPPSVAVLRRRLHWLAHYGKWSMLDVFVVAVLIVSIKLGEVARVEIRYGFYLFSFSVLLTMGLTTLMSRFAWRDLDTVGESPTGAAGDVANR